MGVMGIPLAESGIHSTGQPHRCGGNLDYKGLTAGTVLCLPIEVEGVYSPSAMTMPDRVMAKSVKSPPKRP